MDHMMLYCSFRPDRWQDLLPFLRNLYRHYMPVYCKMPPAIQNVLGPKHDGVLRMYLRTVQ